MAMRQHARQIDFTLLQRVEIEQSKRACERSLTEFVRQAWHIVDPAPYVHGWHIEAICTHLEAVTSGQILMLLINISPRCMKSFLCSVLWPAWEWTLKPQEQYLCASHSAALSTRDTVAMRHLINSPWYQERWGHKFAMSSDQNQKTRFENTVGGRRIATSVGVGTGDGGTRLICLHPDTMIQCSDGQRRIRDLVDMRSDVRVVGYDHNAGVTALCHILRYEKSAGRRSLTMKLASGASVVATHDHPVYVVGRGYIQLEEVCIGDRLLRYLSAATEAETIPSSKREEVGMQRGMRGRIAATIRHHSLVSNMWSVIQKGTSAFGKKHAWNILQPPLCWARTAGFWQPNVDGRTGFCSLHGVWSDSFEETGAQGLSSVLQEMSGDCHEQAFVATKNRKAVHGLRSDNLRISSSNGEAGSVFEDVCSHVAQPACQRRGQWSVYPRRLIGKISTRVSAFIAASASQRRVLLSLVWDAGGGSQGEKSASESACTPHRLRQASQRNVQSDSAMPILPRQNAQPNRPRTPQLAEDIVVSVESTGTPEFVFNVCVADTHNYFANGVLLHNCDDPHQADEAQSAVILPGDIEWLGNTWLMRRNDPKTSAMVTVMQRLHMEDASAWMLAQGAEHLCIPMEYDGIQRKNCLGTYDPRKKVGELMWSARFPKDTVLQLKSGLGEYGSSGQLQQQPAPAGGGILRSKFLRLWPHDEMLPIPRMILQSYDTAQEDDVETDPTACIVALLFDRLWTARSGQKRVTSSVLLIDCWAEKLRYPQLLKRVMRDWRAKYGGKQGDPYRQPKRADIMIIEKKGSGISLVQECMADGIQCHGYNPGNLSKPARARLISPLIEAGLVWILESSVTEGEGATWIKPLLTEMDLFPKAPHDDQVDALVQMLSYLHQHGLIEIPRVEYKDEDYDPDRYTAKQKVEKNWYDG